MPEPKGAEDKQDKIVEGAGDKKPEEKEKKDPTVGEIIDADKKGKKEDKTDAETVPLASFLEEKKARKQLEKDIEDLKKKVDSGKVSEDDIADEIAAIGEEYKVDKGFLNKLTKVIEGRAEKKAADRFSPLEEERRSEKLDKAFNTHFTKAMEDMPEYKGVVNADVIKALSLDPKNSNKTFPQIIEEAYGNALGGKRTIEKTRHRGGKEPESIDFERAKKDTEYFKEIMANPESKKKYNESLTDRLSKSL